MQVKTFRLAGVALLVSTTLAAPIGDFAPLQVGNQWVYQRTDAASTKLYSRTYLEVASKSAAMDTLIYRLEKVDTIFGTPDTLWERTYEIRERNGEILNVKVIRDNYGHFSPEDLVSLGFSAHTFDSSLTRTRTIDSVRHIVMAESVYISGFRTFSITKSEKIRNVGLSRLFDSSGSTGSSFHFSSVQLHSLIRFNQHSFPVSLGSGPVRRAVPEWVQRAALRMLRTLGLDALGRSASIGAGPATGSPGSLEPGR